MMLLRSVIDPELNINIVDLGLVYKAEFVNDCLVVLMTLTTPACPFVDIIESQIESVADSVGMEVRLSFTFDPPWDRSKISPEVLLSKGLL